MGKYFTVAEFVKSDTADKRGIDNRLPKELLPNAGIYINSGYRCPELNKAVGGVDGSFHLTGCAADIDVHDLGENKKLFGYIKEHLPFTELAWEGGGRWVHVALVKGREGEKEVFYA